MWFEYNIFNKSDGVKPIITYFLRLLIILLISNIVTFLLILNLNKLINYEDINNYVDIYTKIGLTSLNLFILLVSWKWTNNFWRRYKNTYTSYLEFTLIDYIFSVIIISELIIIVRFIASFPISSEFAIFFLFNLLLLTAYFISSYFWEKPQEIGSHLPRQAVSDTSDEPIKFFDEDLLNRGDFVKNLFKEIKELNSIGSFVFGLYGKWGDGKSSVLNLLRIILERDKSFIVMNFEPWNFKDEEAILKAFFNTMEKSISKDYVFPSLRKLLFKYQKLISSGLSNIGLNIDFGLQDETIDEVKEKIEKYIDSTGKKLLIIIDEIDRLESEEILIIFKLVRSNSKFKNTVFLLSLDLEKTTDKLTNGNEFLEKIVQKPIPLPKIERTYIDKFVLFSDHKIPEYTLGEVRNLRSNILVSSFGYVTKIQKRGIFITSSNENDKEKMFIRFKNEVKTSYKIGDKVFVEGIHNNNEILLDDPNARFIPFKLSRVDILLERMLRERKITIKQIAEFDKEMVYLYKSQITNLVTNFRDAKRFLNSLDSSYPAIAAEVDPFDFICLELIKVFAKDVYDDIDEQWWFYVGQRQRGDLFDNPFTFLTSNDESKKYDQTIKHFDDLITKSDTIKKTHKSAVRAIVAKLFPYMGRKESISDDARANKKIHTTSFLKYFTLSVPSTELSDAFFEKEFKSWKDNPNEETIKVTFLKLQAQGRLIEFLDRVRSIYLEMIPEDILRVMLETISKNIHLFSKRENGDLWDSEYDRAVWLVLRTLNLRIKKEDIQSELEKIIKSTQDSLFAVDLVLTTKRERGGELYSIYDNTNNMENRKLVSSRLEKHYIDDGNDLYLEYSKDLAWIRILYQWSSNWLDENSPNKEKVGRYIVSIFNNTPNRFVAFLKTFNSGSFEKEWGMNYSEYSRVYDLEIISQLARKFLKQKQLFTLTKEEEEIISKFVELVDSKNKNVKTLNE